MAAKAFLQLVVTGWLQASTVGYVNEGSTSFPSSRDEIKVFLDDRKFAFEPGQTVKSHGIDRSLDPDEISKRHIALAHP